MNQSKLQQSEIEKVTKSLSNEMGVNFRLETSDNNYYSFKALKKGVDIILTFRADYRENGQFSVCLAVDCKGVERYNSYYFRSERVNCKIPKNGLFNDLKKRLKVEELDDWIRELIRVKEQQELLKSEQQAFENVLNKYFSFYSPRKCEYSTQKSSGVRVDLNSYSKSLNIRVERKDDLIKIVAFLKQLEDDYTVKNSC